MKKILLLFISLVFAAGVASAQDYRNAIGLRFGYGVDLTYKHMFNPSNALDVRAHFSFEKDGGIYAIGLYEWSIPVIANGFNFYYGAGAHLGLYNKDFALGIDGVVGLEYKFRNIPLALSLDYIPALNLLTDIDFDPYNFGLGIKFTF